MSHQVCENPLLFAIKHAWQIEESFEMNLILFADEEIECEDDINDDEKPQSNDDQNVNTNNESKVQDTNSSHNKSITIKKRYITLIRSDYRFQHISKVLNLENGDTVRIGIINGKQGLATVQWITDEANNDNSSNNNNNNNNNNNSDDKNDKKNINENKNKNKNNKNRSNKNASINTNTNGNNINENKKNKNQSHKRSLRKSNRNKDKNNNLPIKLKLTIIEESMKYINDAISDSITIILAMPRPKVMNRLFSILSQCGVNNIILIKSFKVEKYYFDSKYLETKRYYKQLLSGNIQARDTKLPIISIFDGKRDHDKKNDLKTFLLEKLDLIYSKENSVRIVCHPGDMIPTISQLAVFKDLGKGNDSNGMDENKENEKKEHEKKENEGNMMNINDRRKQFILAIGAEGGWIDDEIEMFKQCGFQLCSLGPRILRTDVACISLIALLRNYVQIYLDKTK